MTIPNTDPTKPNLPAIEEGKWVVAKDHPFNPEAFSVDESLNFDLPVEQKERIKDLPEGTKLMLVRQDMICTVDPDFDDMGEILASVVTLKHLSAEDSKSAIETLTGEEIAFNALTNIFK